MIRMSDKKTLKIYFKKMKRPFIEIEGVSESMIQELNACLNTSNMRYIKVGDFIFEKERFDYAISE